MKKLITLILAMLMLIWVFPISASAETESLKTPVLQYKLINHDKVALRWSKVEGADKYYHNDSGIFITFENVSPFTEAGVKIGKSLWGNHQLNC